MGAKLLIEQGHQVVAHARNAQRAEHTRRELPGVETVLTGDFASLHQTRALAAAANELGTFDAVIHNAAIGYKERHRKLTQDGVPEVFQINTLSPYMLTALMHRPCRLVYVSSELHRNGEQGLNDLLWDVSSGTAPAPTPIRSSMTCCWPLRSRALWPDVLSNAMEPGWVSNKDGRPNASGNLDHGHRIQVWLAVSHKPQAMVTGEYFYHLQQRRPTDATRRRNCRTSCLPPAPRCPAFRFRRRVCKPAPGLPMEQCRS